MSKIYDITNATGTVINRIVADATFVEAMYPGRYVLIGDAPSFRSAARLQPLTARQIRLALLSIGISDAAVETILAGLPDAQTATIEWRFASGYERDHPLITSLAGLFDLPEAQVDDLWRWAAEL